MKLDAGYEGLIENIHGHSLAVEETREFSGWWTADTQNDPFLSSQLALSATRNIQVGTNIAVAFARSPFVVAQTAWNLAKLSQGRFQLGLGTQVKAHIEKRFSLHWPESPVQAMEEYLDLLRHLFSCFADGERPNFRGEFYQCTLGSPVFTPDTQGYGAPPVGIAAVGKAMSRLAGRKADLVFLHPFTHLKYLLEVSQPALNQGIQERDPGLPPLQVVGSVFIVPTDKKNAEVEEAKVRQRMAFYASTPSYRAVLACLGYEELHEELHALSRRGDWEKMAQSIPEDLFEACAVRGSRSEIPDIIRQRFAGIYDRVVMDATPWIAQA